MRPDVRRPNTWTSGVMRATVVTMAALMVAGVVVAADSPPAAVQGAPRTPSPRSDAATPPGGDAGRGRQVFVKAGCYQCHGREAQGGAGGVRLAPRPLPLAAFSRYVRRPSGQMPPFTIKVLSESQLADVYAFLRAIPEPPPVVSIPLLNQ
jgi:mono/diheme cytochrome c family protein